MAGKSVIKTLYFSPKTDADLIEMYHQLGPKLFAKAIKESLRMVVRPGYRSQFFEDIALDPTSEKDFYDAVTINISFNAENDGDLRSLLNNVKSRRMTHFMKMALRYATGPYYILGFHLIGNDAITKEYQKKELFFIEGASERVIISKTEVVEKTASTETNTVAKEVQSAPVMNAPVFDYDAPVFTSSDVNTSDCEDDDILALLDMM